MNFVFFYIKLIFLFALYFTPWRSGLYKHVSGLIGIHYILYLFSNFHVTFNRRGQQIWSEVSLDSVLSSDNQFLVLQLCFLHPSNYKFDHPRFCYERLEYLGQKIAVDSLCFFSILLFDCIFGMNDTLVSSIRSIPYAKICPPLFFIAYVINLFIH